MKFSDLTRQAKTRRENVSRSVEKGIDIPTERKCIVYIDEDGKTASVVANVIRNDASGVEFQLERDARYSSIFIPIGRVLKIKTPMEENINE
jgi:hypothetical protein